MSKGARIRAARNKDEHEKLTRKQKLPLFAKKSLKSRSRYNPNEELKNRLEVE